MHAGSQEDRPSPSTGSGGDSADLIAPYPARRASRRVAASAVAMMLLIVSRRLHTPRTNVGRVLHFADGTSARVYRETRIGDGLALEPALLVVGFVLRGVRGRGHAAFRLESWLNIPLFVGFPGLRSKLWLAHDSGGRYRGVYEWEGVRLAESYVRALGWVLGLVSVPGTVRTHIVPGVHRDDALTRPDQLAGAEGAWWLPVTVGSTRVR